jgi:hypothetical protein
MRSRSVYGGRRRRVVRRRRPLMGGKVWFGPGGINPLPLMGMARRRRRVRRRVAVIGGRRIRGRGIGSSIGSWLGDRAEGVARNWLGLGRRRRVRRRPMMGRRAMTYVGSARRSRSRYSY